MYKIAQKENEIEVTFDNNDKVLFRKWGNQIISMQDIPEWLTKSSELYQRIKKEVYESMAK